jgi:hypothetical protein
MTMMMATAPPVARGEPATTVPAARCGSRTRYLAYGCFEATYPGIELLVTPPFGEQALQ